MPTTFTLTLSSPLSFVGSITKCDNLHATTASLSFSGFYRGSRPKSLSGGLSFHSSFVKARVKSFVASLKFKGFLPPYRYQHSFTKIITTLNRLASRVTGQTRLQSIATSAIDTVQSIPTSPTSVDLTGVTGDRPAYVFIVNEDKDHFVQVDSASAFNHFPQKITPGKGIYLTPETFSLYAKADTSPVNIRIVAGGGRDTHHIYSGALYFVGSLVPVLQAGGREPRGTLSFIGNLTAIKSGVITYVLRTDGSTARDAYLLKDFGSDQDPVWVTFDMAITPGTLINWNTNGYGAAYLAQQERSTGAQTQDITEYFTGSSPTWSTFPCDPPSPVPVDSTWINFEMGHSVSTDDVYIDGVHVCTHASTGELTRKVLMGQNLALRGGENIVYYRNIKIGTSRGASDLFADDFSGGVISPGWTSTVGDCTVVPDPY